MRNKFESPEVFEAYAEIDLGYYMLQEIIDKGHPNAPKNSIEAMIDKQTDYDKIIDKEMVESAVDCLEHIIKNKKIIEADCSKDLETLEKVKALLP